MLRLLKEPLKYPEKRTSNTFDSFIGVEVEVENSLHSPEEWEFCLLYDDDLKHSQFNCVHDGSLKNAGAEFVFREPLYGKDVITTVKSLSDISKFNKRRFITSGRTSVHVHVDVSTMDLRSFKNYLLLCILLERGMYLAVGDNRYLNNNCVPITDNKEVAEVIKHLELCEFFDTAPEEAVDKYYNELINLCCRTSKYCSINISSVYKYERGKPRGSLEFRIHKGSTNTVDILKWISFLISLKKAAEKFDSTHLPYDFSVKGYRKFLEDLIGLRSTKWFLNKIRNTEDFVASLYKGVRTIQLIQAEPLLNQFELEQIEKQQQFIKNEVDL